MRSWMPALAIAGLVLGLGLSGPVDAQVRPTPGPGGPAPAPGPGPGPGPEQSDQFQFKVCNKSKATLFVAMLYKVSGDNWRYVGWAQYKAGECGPVQGTYPRDSFFWYSENGPGTITYAGTDAQGCINRNDAFDRTVSGNYSCQPGEMIVGFSKITQEQIQNGITLLD